MAYSLCPSSSSLSHDRRYLRNSLSFSQEARLRSFNNFNFRPDSLSLRLGPCLQIARVSLQDSTSQETHKADASNPQNSRDPDSKTKSYIWVNPKSSRASKLRQDSYDARYASLLKMAKSLDLCEATEQSVSQVLRCLGEKILEPDAVTVLNNVTNPKTALLAFSHFRERLKVRREVILYNVTLKVFRKCKDLDGAEKLFDEMLERGVKPDNITFSTMISCARVCSQPNKAVEWFEKMPEYGCDPDLVTYSAMIDAYGRAGNVDRALSLYDRARTEEWKIPAVTFSTLIRIYGKSGNFDGCLNVYEEMKAVGVKPNLVIYNTMLDAMGRANRPWQAKNIYKEMMDSGLSPSWGTYAALLRAYAKANHIEDALTVYKAMKEKGLELNVVLYNSLLATCAEFGYTEEAGMIFEDMKSSGNCKPDGWTFSSLVTIYSCSGKVGEAEAVLHEMQEAGLQPDIYVLTSLIQCYGRANRIDDVVRAFDRLLELDITPDDRLFGCMLNVMTKTPKEELGKLIDCIDKAKPKLGNVVKLLLEEMNGEGTFRKEALELFDSISADVKKAYCNCLIDMCVNLNLLEKASELFDLGLTIEIYTDIQSKSSTQWSLHLKSLSLGAALTALHIWMNDLSKALETGEELPAVLGINTGHGKHKYSDKGLAGALESHLKELNAPFHDAPDKVGWFLTTKVAATSWLQSRSSPELAAA